MLADFNSILVPSLACKKTVIRLVKYKLDAWESVSDMQFLTLAMMHLRRIVVIAESLASSAS